MADLTNINQPTAKPAAAPTTNNCSATTGPDRVPLQSGGKYLFIWNNTGGAAITVKMDDPVSPSPANADTFDPDVSVVVTNGQRRVQRVDANRHRDPATGFCTFVYSPAVTTMTLEVHGPE